MEAVTAGEVAVAEAVAAASVLRTEPVTGWRFSRIRKGDLGANRAMNQRHLLVLLAIASVGRLRGK